MADMLWVLKDPRFNRAFALGVVSLSGLALGAVTIQLAAWKLTSRKYGYDVLVGVPEPKRKPKDGSSI